MSEVNTSLCQSMEQDMNVTMVLAQFDIDNKQMTLVMLANIILPTFVNSR